MATTQKKLKYLLWKNFTLLKGEKKKLVAMFIIPLVFGALVIFLRRVIDPHEKQKQITFGPLQTKNFVEYMSRYDPHIQFSHNLAYSPKNPVLNNLVTLVLTQLQLPESGSVVALEDDRALEMFLLSNHTFAGIEFENSLNDIKVLPKSLKYSLRFPNVMRSSPSSSWMTADLFEVTPQTKIRNLLDEDGGSPANYYREGFLAVQNLLFRNYYNEIKTATTEIPDISVQRFPYPEYYEDDFVDIILPIIMYFLIFISFSYFFTFNVTNIVTEKERQLKEVMKMMGLTNGVNWAAWFIYNIAILLVIVIFLVIVFCMPFKTHLKGQEQVKVIVLRESNWFLVFLLLLFFATSVITLSYLISVLFSKAASASLVAGLVYFGSFILTAVFDYETTSLLMKIILSILSNVAIGYGCKLLNKLEATGEGMKFSNLFTPFSENDNFAMGYIMLILIADTIIYFLLTLYIERVFPGQFGVGDPWNFCLQSKTQVTAETVQRIPSNKLKNVEAPSAHFVPGVKIRGLTKEYNNKKVAVNDLYLDMYKDQITVLLGHNGAGKTTTMSMLTGLFPPTSGTAIINNADIRANMDGVRSSLGLCPQYNVLFDDLTVEEHLYFFGGLKGVPELVIAADSQRMLDILGLSEKAKNKSKTLSGGMKRRLSVAIALIGGSKVIFLDEPTSGMDPASRRFLWDLLAAEKKNRTILLSTHFMDEADVLGDRIAIMAHGELKACGSSFYLKKKFGVGYRLVCVKEEYCDPQNVTKLLQKYIPSLKIASDVGLELAYRIDDEYLPTFVDLLSDLEDNSEALGVSGFGLSRTTLEEVFHRVGTDTVNMKKNRRSTIHFLRSHLVQSSGALHMNHIKAMLLKRYYSTKRHLLVLLFMITFPMLLLLQGLTDSGTENLDQRLITVDSYEKLDILVYDEIKNPKLLDSYEEVDEGSKIKVEPVAEDIQTYILNIAHNTNLIQFNQHYIVAASFLTSKYIAWFNNKAYHSAPLSLNLIHNAILKEDCGSSCDISVTNKPVFYEREKIAGSYGPTFAGSITFSWAFVGGLLIMFYIRERVSGMKLMQFINGVSIMIFWTISFLWDFLLLLIISLILIVYVGAFQKENFSTPAELGWLYLIFCVMNWVLYPMVLVLSLLFDNAASGFVSTTSLFFFFGSLMYQLLTILEGFNQEAYNIINKILLILPFYAFTEAILKYDNVRQLQKACDSLENSEELPFCQDLDMLNFKEGIARSLLYMFLVGLVAWIIILMWDYRVIGKFLRLFRPLEHFFFPLTVPAAQALDDDVQKERSKIENMRDAEIHSQPLIVKNLSKYYNRLHPAVNQLYLQVGKSECFGLLGVNGAGKTTTFKMLAGDISITSGDAFVHGKSVKNNMTKVYRHIGYCPQFDMLLDDLTGRETLLICSLIRGVQPQYIPDLSQGLIDKLNFERHIDKKVGEYSGGNKRKLSTAVAIVGNPSVLYLDEPSSGMDPDARRQLWNTITSARDAGLAVVLTSHSMDECEALCTRLAIMVDGEFKCLGSLQHLKNKFAKGYILNIIIAKSERTVDNLKILDEIKQFVAQNIPGSILKEEYEGSLTFEIRDVEMKLSNLFGIMEDSKEELHIEDYSLGQLTIEQVFLAFTKNSNNNV